MLNTEPMTAGATLLTQVEYITPEIAKRWLMKKYPGQRSIRPHRVALYAADMQAGRWQLTHQGIAFDVNGRLVDGQHRLAAIVQAGISVDMLVVRGLPGQTFVGMDRGMLRGAHDNAPEPWMANRSLIAAARGAMRGYDGLKGGSGTTRRPTDWETFAFMDHHRTALECVGGFFTKHAAGVGQAMVQAAFVRAFYHAEEPFLSQCATTLKTGILPDENFSGMASLRTFLTSPSMRRGGGAEVQFETYAKAERALLATLNGERLYRLRAATEELFPLPDIV